MSCLLEEVYYKCMSNIIVVYVFSSSILLVSQQYIRSQSRVLLSSASSSSLYNYHGIIIHAIFSDFYFLTYNVMYACVNLYHTLWSNSSISRRIILLPMFDRLLAFCFYDISTKTSLDIRQKCLDGFIFTTSYVRLHPALCTVFRSQSLTMSCIIQCKPGLLIISSMLPINQSIYSVDFEMYPVQYHLRCLDF